MKKGYKAEWEVKKILFEKYPPGSILKVAIGGTVDFCVLGKRGKIKKFVEVKKTNKKNWYPGNHDFSQFQRLLALHKQFKIPIEYWIKIKGKWKIFDIQEMRKFFNKNETI